MSVADRVTAELRRSIVSGALRPGREFSLRQIAAQLGVSFIPVREALRNLEAEGLVVTRHGRSAMVSPLDRAELHAIYRLRRQIEPELAAESSASLRAGDLDVLAEILTGRPSDELDHLDERELDQLHEDHMAFHLALLRPAATDWDLRVLQMLWRAAERYIRFGFTTLGAEPGQRARSVVTHRILLDAVRTGDPDAVRQAVLDHLVANEKIAERGITATAG
jgi:DNA-binding GntR family transcriptional regulator